MAGKRLTKAQRAKYLKLRQDGLSQSGAAEKLGFSRTTAWRIERGLIADTHAEEDRKLSFDLPDPLPLEKLSKKAHASLEDFGLWTEQFLAWDRKAWQRHAAELVISKLLEREERSFGVINLPPGSGKTSVFTFAIPGWLLCGGGFVDPALGRALRILLGHEGMKVAKHYVLRLRRLLEMRRPFYNKEDRRYAPLVLAREFGRFRPDQSYGEESMWSQEQFLVAQVGTDDAAGDLYEKEPSVQAAARDSGFIGERVDYSSWDDVVTIKRARNPDVTAADNEWFEAEAEARTEPGGLCLAVGQRLGPADLFRKRLDVRVHTPEGGLRPKYFHVIYPVHNDATCTAASTGEHTEWDLNNEGCLLDADRHPWSDILTYQASPNYRTVYQQEDADPDTLLIQQAWLDGTPDANGYTGPGCWDEDRGFFEWPKGVSGLIDYVTVDPAAGGWWAVEWWSVQPETRARYLIAGWRKKMQAGALLDYSVGERRHVGLMQELQAASTLSGHPIRVWVVEQNSAFKHLFQFDHFKTWTRKWHDVATLAHTTGANKLDEELGVEAAMPLPYKMGLKRLPRKRGDASWLNYLKVKTAELTKWPLYDTDDTLMADWFGETNLERIIAIGRRTRPNITSGLKLPPYLERQRMAAYTGGE